MCAHFVCGCLCIHIAAFFSRRIKLIGAIRITSSTVKRKKKAKTAHWLRFVCASSVPLCVFLIFSLSISLHRSMQLPVSMRCHATRCNFLVRTKKCSKYPFLRFFYSVPLLYISADFSSAIISLSVAHFPIFIRDVCCSFFSRSLPLCTTIRYSRRAFATKLALANTFTEPTTKCDVLILCRARAFFLLYLVQAVHWR